MRQGWADGILIGGNRNGLPATGENPEPVWKLGQPSPTGGL